MPSKLTLIEQKLQVLSILSNNNSIIKFEDIIKERKLKINITNAISSIKAISLDTTSANNSIKGKITTDNTKPIIGIAINNSLANAENEIITNGIIEDNSLTGGTVGQAVYINNSGSLSLVINGLRVGRILTTTAPIKVWINPGREYDELQEFLIIQRTLYFALRYLSYYLPFSSTNNPNFSANGVRGYGNGILALIDNVDGEISYSPDLNLYVSVTGFTLVSRTDYSSNGTIWTSSTTPQMNTWKSVTWGNGVFVAVSSDGVNRVMTSPDGINWTLRNASQANQWNSVTYGNGVFVAVSEDGTNRVMTSPDGITWTNQNASQANAWRQVIFDGTQFIAAAISGTNRIMTSPDGVTWTNVANTSAVTGNVVFGNGTYLASTTTGYLISTDAIIWYPTLAQSAGGTLVYNEIDGIFYGRYGLYEYTRSAEL